MTQSHQQRRRFTYNSDTKYKIFVTIWAIAALFHMGPFQEYTNGFHLFMLTISSILVMNKPGSLIRFLIFIAIQVYIATKDISHISNHWLFTAFVNLSILQTYLYLVYTKKSFHIDRNEFIERFSPIIRIEVLILYFYVVFHKLNSGFFNPDFSCAAEFLKNQDFSFLVNYSDQLFISNAYLTIIIEAIIPIFLCFRKTRNLGILIGLLFHFILAFNPLKGFYDFSSMIFALYFLFSDNIFIREFVNHCNNIYSRIINSVKRFRQFSYTNLIVIVFLFILGLVSIHVLYKLFPDYIRYILWSMYSIIFIAIFFTAMLKKGIRYNVNYKPFKLTHWSFFIIPVFVFLNGFTPYLGLKTENAFAMFSNLRTEGGKTNHYIIPTSFQIFDFQKDLVEVVSSTDETLQNTVETNRLYVYSTFQLTIQSRKPEFVEYIRNGKHYTFKYKEASKNHELLKPVPFYLKIMRFRKISKFDEQPCSH